ncbi:hypothetical protein C8R43DRAFT_485318 [Mycena crocata]|nr:hypothetical protein C8R43DRAFT_485318 [Mycena crocata]
MFYLLTQFSPPHAPLPPPSLGSPPQHFPKLEPHFRRKISALRVRNACFRHMAAASQRLEHAIYSCITTRSPCQFSGRRRIVWEAQIQGVRLILALRDPPCGSQASARPRSWAAPGNYKYRPTHPPIFHSNHHPLLPHSPLTTSGLYLDILDAPGAVARRRHCWCLVRRRRSHATHHGADAVVALDADPTSRLST